MAGYTAHESGYLPATNPMIRGVRNPGGLHVQAPLRPLRTEPTNRTRVCGTGVCMKIQSLITAIGVAVTSLFPFTAFADDDEIIVTATRQPTALRQVLPTAHVITRSDIDRIQPKDLPSLLGRIGGVDFRDTGGRGSVSGVFIRGASPSQSIVLIDGMRSASASVGATTLEAIPIESIERIEIVKGPLSGLYGADAIGGVIQIFTQRGQQQRATPAVHVRYRTDDTQEYTAELNGGNERGGFHVSFGFETTQGIDRTTIKTGGNADRDGYDEFALNASGNYRLLDELEARVSFLRTDAHSEFDNTFGPDTGFDSDNKIENNTLKLVYTPLESLRLSFDAGHFVDENVTPVFGSDITAKRTSVSLQADYRVHADHTITAGVDYYDDKIDTLAPFAFTSRENIGGFFQWQGRYGDFQVVGSGRYDDNEVYGTDSNGSVAVEYRFAANLAAVVSYGTAFRAPSFNDLFFPGFGNPNVRPEESESVEVSLKGQHLALDWRLSAYHTDVIDLIGFDAATFTAANTADATLQGIELEFGYRSGPWNFNANLNYLDARDDTTDIYLDGRARFATNVEVYRSIGKFDLSVDLQAESGRHDLRGTRITGFTTAGLGANYRVTDKLRIAARLDNVWDEDYALTLVNATDAFRTYGRTAMVSLHARY